LRHKLPQQEFIANPAHELLTPLTGRERSRRDRTSSDFVRCSRTRPTAPARPVTSRSTVPTVCRLSLVDSVGIGVLAAAARRVKSTGGSFVLAADDPRLLRTLKMKGLDRLFDIEPNLMKAGTPVEAERAIERLLELTSVLARRAAQLQEALDSRIIIEQAKGILAERYRIDVEDASGSCGAPRARTASGSTTSPRG
jgi:hypothetical protein